jgi:hypothetical protein
MAPGLVWFHMHSLLWVDKSELGTQKMTSGSAELHLWSAQTDGHISSERKGKLIQVLHGWGDGGGNGGMGR